MKITMLLRSSKDHGNCSAGKAITFAMCIWIGLVSGAAHADQGVEDVVSLEGSWAFRLDPERVGIKEKWYSQLQSEKIKLPGTTDENGYGQKTPERQLVQLTRVYRYYGYAWYQRPVIVDAAWKGKNVQLFLERCQWDSRVWVNGRFVGMCNSLAAPHIYDLTGFLKPGENLLSILVDNSNVKDDFAVKGSEAGTQPAEERPKHRDLTYVSKVENKLNCGGHHTVDATQTAWNGLVGRIELHVADRIRIEHVNVYPDVRAKRIKATLDISNASATSGAAKVKLLVKDRQTGADIVRGNWPLAISAQPEQRAQFEMDMGKDVRLWSEFDPSLYDLEVELTGEADGRTFHDSAKATFGMRELRSENGSILVNGRPVFLRGTLECGVFPLTGYAPMDIASWLRVLKIAKSYGLNHLRFHSWCPPEAAFEAADQLGFMFQVEPGGTSCPEKDEPREVSDFLLAECLRMVETYGNHPSFCFLSVGGNEQLVNGNLNIERHQKLLMDRLDSIRSLDPRHLYTCCTQPYTAGRRDDYYVSAWGPKWEPLCAMQWGGPDPLKGSRFNKQPPSTLMDYGSIIARIEGPIISHEVGQWAVFPNIEEIPKYTGVLAARNLEIIRDKLKEHGLVEQAHDFVMASGKLALALYKEDIESALRTPGFDGFQLLDLHDYPGQGTSTVGILDAFWESKGLTTPEEFRKFCAPTVPLLRMPKRVWTDEETFQAECEVANYGTNDLADANPIWSLVDERGVVLAQGQLPRTTIRVGGVQSLGKVSILLKVARAPGRLVFRLSLKGTPIANDWFLWVYPATQPIAEPTAIDVVTSWPDAKVALNKGRTVLLLAFKPLQHADSIPGVFTTLFWNTLMKNPQPGTMGILCDPRHPCLASFPTEGHSDWQWWDLVMHSRTMILDDMPQSFRPIVQVIDKFETSRKLGVLLEARVGEGRLMVCSVDLATDMGNRPVARQLRRSILEYMAGPSFQPKHAIETKWLDKKFAAQ